MQNILRFVLLTPLLFSHPLFAELTLHSETGTFGCRRAFGYGVYNETANKTVVCWNAETMSIYAREYDHDTNEWSEVQKVYGLDYKTRFVYHNYPCIVQAPDGHYLIFYFNHSRTAFLLRSEKPNSIAGNWSWKKISDDRCCYPMPIVANDTVYLFYSRTIERKYRPYRVIKSADSGITWSEPKTVIDTQEKQAEEYNEVYSHGYCVQKDKEGNAEKIVIGWEMASGPKGHNVGSYGSFVSVFGIEDEKMYTAGGKDLGDFVDLDEMYTDCIINDAKDPTTRIFNYTTFPEILPDGSIGVLYSLKSTRQTYIAKWNDGQWKHNKLDMLENWIVDDYQKTIDGKYVILARDFPNITVWVSPDGVSNWIKDSEATLPSTNAANTAHMGFIHDFRKPVQWLAATYCQEQRRLDYSGTWPVCSFGTVEEAH